MLKTGHLLFTYVAGLEVVLRIHMYAHKHFCWIEGVAFFSKKVAVTIYLYGIHYPKILKTQLTELELIAWPRIFATCNSRHPSFFLSFSEGSLGS